MSLESLNYRIARKMQTKLYGVSLKASSAAALIGAKMPQLHFKEPSRVAPTLEKMMGLKGVAGNRRCVILGSAPSVVDIDLSRVSRDFVITLNKAYELNQKMGRNPDAVIATNPYAVQEYGAELFNAAEQYIFLSASAAVSLPPDSSKLIVFAQWEFPKMSDGFFQLNAGKPLYRSGTVAHSAVQIAVWMGFKEIVMIGVDLSFQEGKNHFYESSDAEDSRSRRASVDNTNDMINGLSVARKQIEDAGEHTLSCIGSPDSNNPLQRSTMDDIWGS